WAHHSRSWSSSSNGLGRKCCRPFRPRKSMRNMPYGALRGGLPQPRCHSNLSTRGARDGSDGCASWAAIDVYDDRISRDPCKCRPRKTSITSSAYRVGGTSSSVEQVDGAAGRHGASAASDDNTTATVSERLHAARIWGRRDAPSRNGQHHNR